jgi:hypothetical protein
VYEEGKLQDEAAQSDVEAAQSDVEAAQSDVEATHTYCLCLVVLVAMATVTTAQDFTLIFDAYSQYEESMLEAQMASLTEVSPTLVPCCSVATVPPAVSPKIVSHGVPVD